MTTKELNKLDYALAQFELHLQTRYTLHPGHETVFKARRIVAAELVKVKEYEKSHRS